LKASLSAPEISSLVTRCGYDAALGRMADRDRPSLESGIVALFDGRVEGVHVDVDDPANPPLVH
jgi:hypothetical protein